MTISVSTFSLKSSIPSFACREKKRRKAADRWTGTTSFTSSEAPGGSTVVVRTQHRTLQPRKPLMLGKRTTNSRGRAFLWVGYFCAWTRLANAFEESPNLPKREDPSSPKLLATTTQKQLPRRSKTRLKRRARVNQTSHLTHAFPAFKRKGLGHDTDGQAVLEHQHAKRRRIKVARCLPAHVLHFQNMVLKRVLKAATTT